MEETEGAAPAEGAARLSPAREGTGPLLQRDYWCVIDGCAMRPSEVMRLVTAHFERFAPEELVRFDCRAAAAPNSVGDVVDIQIAGAGACEVQVIHADALSFTLATIAGHPEAGRITFGAYRNDRGDVVFHIRSRARSSDALRYVGFLGVGEAMQTRTWTAFVNRVAVAAGRGPVGMIHADTEEIEDEPEHAVRSAPTYVARGD